MKSDHVEEILNQAARNVALKWAKDSLRYDPDKDEFVSGYVHNTMLDPEWDALEMFQYELMALKMRKQYGFNQTPEQD